MIDTKRVRLLVSPYNKHEDSLAHIGRTSVVGTTNMGGPSQTWLIPHRLVLQCDALSRCLEFRFMAARLRLWGLRNELDSLTPFSSFHFCRARARFGSFEIVTQRVPVAKWYILGP